MTTDPCIYGYIDSDSWLRGVFPNNEVPLISPFPIYPRGLNSPACYLVDGNKLSEETKIEVAQKLIEIRWSNPASLQTLEQALPYIRLGLPIACAHFRKVEFNYLLWISLPWQPDT